MAVKKNNFKIIGEIKEENLKEQEEIFISNEEKALISNTLNTFFSAIKVLLEEGAVLSNKNNQNSGEYFLNDPKLMNAQTKPNSLQLHNLAILSLSKEKSEKLLNQIEEIKMNKDYDFSIKSKTNIEIFDFVSAEISNHLKIYSLALPDIMKKRNAKIKALIEMKNV